MATQTDEAERRVRAQRALIEQKLGDLEGRMGEDIAHARDRLQHHVTHMPDLVPGGPRLIEQVEEHPLTAMAGGLGIGVLAGVLTGGGDDRDRGSSGSRSGRDAGSGMLMGVLTNSLISPLRPYVEDAAREVIAGFSDRQRPPGERTQREGARSSSATSG